MPCANCGSETTHHKHHVFGRSRKETVDLCANCHVEHHGGLLYMVNEFTRACIENAMKEIERKSSLRFVGMNEQKEILKRNGYDAAVRKYKKARR